MDVQLHSNSSFSSSHIGETRGGCLSIKKHRRPGNAVDGSQGEGSADEEEVVYSYNDRVDEITFLDFRNILLNFVQTAFALRPKLLSLRQLHQRQKACPSAAGEEGNDNAEEAAAKVKTVG